MQSLLSVLQPFREYGSTCGYCKNGSKTSKAYATCLVGSSLATPWLTACTGVIVCTRLYLIVGLGWNQGA